MDYDQTSMPASYDAGRGYSSKALQTWLDKISAVASGRNIEDILDLGCGTGRYSSALAAHFAARVTGVDPSEKMLAEARKKSSGAVHFLRGSAEAIPLTDGSVDMVFMSMVLHHFADPRQAARECHRVLREGGMVCLRAASCDRIDGYPHTRFFPSERPMMNAALASLSEIEAIFIKAGFSRARHEVVESEVAGSWLQYAEKTAHRADSFLAQLSDEEFAAGLAALRRYAEHAPSEPVFEQVDFFAFERSA
ncbi:MAG: methyltransferase domain-containing protein [Alphaproteobacteria bacterium]